MECHTTFDARIRKVDKEGVEVLYFLNRKKEFDAITRKIVVQSLALSAISYNLRV